MPNDESIGDHPAHWTLMGTISPGNDARFTKHVGTLFQYPETPLVGHTLVHNLFETNHTFTIDIFSIESIDGRLILLSVQIQIEHILNVQMQTIATVFGCGIVT